MIHPQHARPALAAALWAVLGGLAGVVQGGLGLWLYLAPAEREDDVRLKNTVAVVSREVTPYWLQLERAKAIAVVVLGSGLVLAGTCLLASPATARMYCGLYILLTVPLHWCYAAFELLLVSRAVRKHVYQGWAAAGGHRSGAETDLFWVEVGVAVAAFGFIIHAIVLAALLGIKPYFPLISRTPRSPRAFPPA